MDVNGDGMVDVLSGSYSHTEAGKPMRGGFQVLYGAEGNVFTPAKELLGTDDRPLTIGVSQGDDPDLDRICTRPFAVDLDGDGKLDLVAGNFRGTFAFFAGEGNGKFAPASKLLVGKGGALEVDHHSDPCLADWDGDGDHDLLSGASDGGVFLFVNKGSKKKPKFDDRKQLVAYAVADETGALKLGDAHLKAPQTSTRVWVDDVDGNGKLDLFVGDCVTLTHAAQGVTVAAIQKDLPAIDAKIRAHDQAYQGVGSSDAALAEWRGQREALAKEREKYVRAERTGFVWLYLRK